MGLFSIFRQKNTLYYPGCYTFYKYPEFFENYKRIFNRLDIDFKIIDKQVCCGLPAYEAGYETESRKVARRNLEIFKEEKIDSIITNSPCCQKMFMQEYPKILPDWNLKVKNIWEIILEKLKNKEFLIKNKSEDILTYSDSCHLGRYCGIYNEPREILSLLGFQVKEMQNTKEEAFCSGSCGNLPLINPELADEIAKEKLLQAKRIGVKKIVVASIEEYHLLKKNSKEIGIEVLELGEVLALALGLKKEEKIPEQEKFEEKEDIFSNIEDKDLIEEEE
ncbi:MAG: (Fe-S)-binding protein [Candidatus Pacearchaeota archaeon]|jgi:Fe-S oxidoreductase